MTTPDKVRVRVLLIGEVTSELAVPRNDEQE
jgi:hypothetical protein